MNEKKNRLRVWFLVSASGLAAAAGSCSRKAASPAPASSLALSTPYELDTLDPHARDWAGSMAIAANFYEPLVTTDASMQLKPALAASWESPDPLTWIFHLRKSVRFHSGRPLTAEDVVYSFTRLRGDPSLKLGNSVRGIAQARALGPLTVQVTTDRPFARLLYHLQYALIVPRGSGSESLDRAVDGTGPYLLGRWTRGERIEMRRNPAYWGEAPRVERVAYGLGRSSARSLRELLTGRSQLAQLQERTDVAAAAARPDVTVQKRSSLFVTYLQFNVSAETHPGGSTGENPFSRPEVREAIDRAIDRSGIAAALPAEAIPASQLVAPAVYGYSPSVRVPEIDLAGARRLLRIAGYPDGFTATLCARPMMAAIAGDLREMLGRIGVRLRVEILPDPAFFALAERREAALILNRFACDTEYAGEALDQVIHTRDPGRRLGENNYGHFSDPGLDAEIDEIDEASFSSDARDTVREIMRRVAELRPIIPLVVAVDVYATRRDVVWEPRDDSDIRAAEIGLTAAGPTDRAPAGNR